MRILFVCTGNICRSPMGERLTRAFLDDALGASAAAVGTASAGTNAVVGKGMEPKSALVLSGLGGDPAGFVARQLTADMVDAADLTLTMTRRHRRDALKLAPRAMFRTYTLREAAGLLEQVDLRRLPSASSLDERAHALVAALGAQRATRRHTERESDDVFDPIGRKADVHQRVGELIFDSLMPLLHAICGTGHGVPAPRAAVPDFPATSLIPAIAAPLDATMLPPSARRSLPPVPPRSRVNSASTRRR
ncbi:arsenate reductase/protein-tyrosine-phosphatase family protein [Blastococcus sp. SYSU DS1021]